MFAPIVDSLFGSKSLPINEFIKLVFPDLPSPIITNFVRCHGMFPSKDGINDFNVTSSYLDFVVVVVGAFGGRTLDDATSFFSIGGSSSFFFSKTIGGFCCWVVVVDFLEEPYILKEIK